MTTVPQTKYDSLKKDYDKQEQKLAQLTQVNTSL